MKISNELIPELLLSSLSMLAVLIVPFLLLASSF